MNNSIYHVSISQIVGSGNSAGFIDATKIEYYTTDVPATQDSLDKERANLRYIQTVNNLHMMANMNISNIVALGADESTPPTVFSFDVDVDRGDSVLMTHDETANGVLIYGNAALKRCVARALSTDFTIETEFRWDDKLFFKIDNIHVGALGNISTVQGSITVTKIA